MSRPGGGLPLFEKATFVQGDYLVASRTVGQRWFGGIRNAPSPPAEPFARVKPDRAFRAFVLGESTTAGFPYPRNATFSRLLRDVLRDVLPGDSVEVVNLGIAATNSFAMRDMAGEIAVQRPDVVLIYAGHNEYYGALGAASRVAIPGGSGAVLLYLRLLRLRTVLALRSGLAALRGDTAETREDLEAASLMEVLARDRQVPLGSSLYTAGLRQFEQNLAATVRAFTRRGIPVLVGSLVSNVRDQAPFAADANALSGGAVPVFDSGPVALAAGDNAAAARLFARARDLDVVRFRAPGEFNDVIRRVALAQGATYVPVSEAFTAASRAGIPGSELLLEHVHPNRAGQALIGRAFFGALLAANVLGQSADTTRLRDWEEYAAGMALTQFDERIAAHTIRTLTTRWPFVPVDRQSDYRGTYVPSDLGDSLAFAVSRGVSWEQAKLQLAAEYERRRDFGSAAAEYAGLARDAQLFEEPLRLLARALGLAGRGAEAEAALRRAVAIRPTPQSLAALGAAAVRRRELAEAVSLFGRSLALNPNQPDVLYQLSLTYGMANDISRARATALQLARLNPNYPGLADWLASLGVR
ncbi:MAG: GDSL-type esterase/lipase family protein [Gemmatimonadaceae bacterium]